MQYRYAKFTATGYKAIKWMVVSCAFAIPLRFILWQMRNLKTTVYRGVRAKMNNVVLVLLIPLLQSCANSLIVFEKGSWDETGVSKQVFQKAGENAIDCGFHNLLSKEGKKSIKVGFECVRRAISQNKSFMFGTYRIPLDSYAMEILIKPPSDNYWTIVYDRMLDEDESQLWLHACKSVKLYRHQLSYEGKQCSEKTNAEWL